MIPPAHGEEYVGSAGCKSSSCHGGAGPKRSQYITWSQQDFHSRAHAVLANARSARMAETLQLGQAQSSARCTVCHSPFQTIAGPRLTEGAEHADQGVSCETCHNAAGGWLRGHTRPDWSYATRVTAGMRDLRNLYVRANTCVACHQNVDRDVLASGHPEMRFELDGQSVAEPKHWTDEPGTGAKTWLVGQAVALREISWALAKIETADEDEVARWSGLAWLLGKIASQPELPILDAVRGPAVRASFIDMQGRADAFARAASAATIGSAFATDTLQTLLSSESEFRQRDVPNRILARRAERLAPAVNRLAIAAGLDSDVSPRPEGRELLDTVQRGAVFDPARFSAAFAKYRDALAKPAVGK
ncbi:MAG: multiheme c-type cytochrome [Chthoniobacterales bacterium]